MSAAPEPAGRPDPPLAGIRVLDIATFLAAPFCGTVLADFGAEVLKIEQPGAGDPLRRFGTVTECGDTLIWLSEARNKKSITLDLRQPEGAELLRRMVAKSDVLLENFRPGTLERWGLGWEALHAINPRLVMLRVSAYGQEGPYRNRPGFARIAHAFSGLAYLAGEPGRLPVTPGSTSLADYMSGVWGALGVMMALRVRDRSGVGQVVDIGLYESVFRLLDEIAPAYEKYGFARERMGADTVNVVPHSHYPTRDGRYVAIACSSDKMFERLAAAMGRPELAAPDRFGRTAARVAARDEVNRIVSDWTSALDSAEVLARAEAHEVPCGLLYSIKDIMTDPQYAARGNLQRVQDPRVGEMVVPAAVPRLSETPAVLDHLGESLGAHNDEVYRGLLGLDAATLARLRAEGVI